MEGTKFYQGLTFIDVKLFGLKIDGHPKMAKISHKIINGMKNVYAKYEHKNKTVELSAISNPINIVDKPNSALIDYRARANKLYTSLAGVKPLDILKNVKTISNANLSSRNISFPKSFVNNIKQLWTEFRLIYNEHNHDQKNIDLNVNKPVEDTKEINLDNKTLESDASTFSTVGPIPTVENIKKDSYVISNFDSLFDDLANDVTGANKFIGDLINMKNDVDKSNKLLDEARLNMEKEKADFDELIKVERSNIEKEKAQALQQIEDAKIKLQNEEAQFRVEMESIKAELALKNEALIVEQNQLKTEREQYAKQKELSEENIKNDRTKIDTEREQFEKQQRLGFEEIKTLRTDLDDDRLQFEKTKELENRKLELERKSLSQSCERFKELVSQFNNGVGQLPNE